MNKTTGKANGQETAADGRETEAVRRTAFLLDLQPRSSGSAGIVRLFYAYSVVAGILLSSLGLAPGCRVPNRHVKTIRPQGCAECHVEIACQWQSSPHAIAWTSPTFQQATDQATSTACLPCHAPEPLLEQQLSDRPTLRADYRQDGVDCHACHANCGGYVGRYQTFGPHPMVPDGIRLPCSEFCGTCHTTEMEEYAEEYTASYEPDELASCADCHMPRYSARMTQGHFLSLIHPRRAVPDHSFELWNEKLTSGSVEVVSVRAEPVDFRLLVRVTLINRGAGHRIPTGKFGHREVRILAVAEGIDRQAVGQAEESLVARTSSALLPGKPTEFVLAVPLSGDAPPQLLRLSVERVNEDRTFRHTLATAEMEISSEPR